MGRMRPRNDSTKSKSKVTGKKFNRQDPNGRRHGPQPRRKVYAMAIEKVLDSHWGDEWLTSSEIAYMANKDISNHWTQLNGFSVGAIMRKYEKSGHVKSERKGKTAMKKWKRIVYFNNPPYKYYGGNSKHEWNRVWDKRLKQYVNINDLEKTI